MTTASPETQQYSQFGGEGSIAGVDSEGIMRTIQEIERQHMTKVDVVVPANSCKAVPISERDPKSDGYVFKLGFIVPIAGAEWLTSGYTMQLNANAHAQLASLLGITKAYYDKLLTAAREDVQAMNLLCENINHWLDRHGKRFLVRTLDNHVRAFLSDSYKPRDNYDLVNAVLQPIQESGASITRLDLTESRMYIRVLHKDWRARIERQHLDVVARNQVFQSWMADLKADDEGNIPYFSRLAPRPVNLAPNPFDPNPQPQKPDGGFGLVSTWDDDWIIPGAVIQNSEIGQGQTSVSPFALREICNNGTVMDAVVGVRHVGSAKNVLDGFLSAETIALENAAIYAVVRDLLTATFDPAKFKAMVDRMSEAANAIIEHPIETLDRNIGQFKIDPDLRQSLLNNLIAGGDPTKWGLINAVTATARELDNYDERVALERVGGAMLEDLELVRVR